MGFLTMVISFQIYLKFQEGYQSCHNSLGFRKTWNSKNMGRLFQMMMIQKHGSFNLWVQKLFFFGFFFGSFYPCTWKAGTSEITQLKGKSSSKAPFLGSMLIFRGVFARWLNIPKLVSSEPALGIFEQTSRDGCENWHPKISKGVKWKTGKENERQNIFRLFKNQSSQKTKKIIKKTTFHRSDPWSWITWKQPLKKIGESLHHQGTCYLSIFRGPIFKCNFRFLWWNPGFPTSTHDIDSTSKAPSHHLSVVPSVNAVEPRYNFEKMPIFWRRFFWQFFLGVDFFEK